MQCEFEGDYSIIGMWALGVCELVWILAQPFISCSFILMDNLLGLSEHSLLICKMGLLPTLHAY